MRKKLFFIIVLFVFVFLTACGGVKLSFVDESASLAVGDEKTLAVNVSDKDAVLEWNSSDNDIAKVNEVGKLTGIAVGEVVITVKVKDGEAEASINVTVEAFNGTISFENESVNILAGTSQKLTPIITPAKVFALSWNSDNPSVAEVDNTGKVTAKAVGTAVVRVLGGGLSASVSVNVILPDPASIVITGAEVIHKSGTSVPLTAIVAPALAPQGVTWSSSDDEIATVTAEGVVTFTGVGSVTITAASTAKPSVANSVTIQVIEPDPASIVITTESGEPVVFLYGELQLYAEVLPAGAQQVVYWGVSDENLAIVTEDGVIYGFEAGVVTVTATSNVDDDVFATIEITIYQPDPEEVIVIGAADIIQVEEEMKLSVEVRPALASQSVVFESSDPAVATVSSAGVVTGVGPGDAVITVKSAVKEEISASYDIKVVAKVTEPTHNKVVFNPEYAELEKFSEITLDDLTYYIGVNAFANADECEVKEGAELYFYPGVYEGNLVINKDNVTVKSPNADANPTEDDAAFKEDSATAVTIKGMWTVNANNITIKGFSFTGAARVKSYSAKVAAGFKDFLFENNYVYDTDEATIAWSEGAFGSSSDPNAAIPGFISLYPADTYLHDYEFINNKFSNVSDIHIHMFLSHNTVIKGNIFSGGERDAFRVESSLTYGNLVIEDNIFENLKYNGVFIRWQCNNSSLGSLRTTIHNNTFKNIGEAGKNETPERSRIGAIADPYSGEGNSVYFDIQFNLFENCVNYISLRDNVTSYNTWTGKKLEREVIIKYNAFIDENPVTCYFNNLFTSGDTPAANTGHVEIDHNFYGVSATEKAVINNANNESSTIVGQFGYRRSGENNETVYDTYESLLTAIEGLE